MGQDPRGTSVHESRLVDFGDAGLLLTVTGGDTESRWANVHAVADAVECSGTPGVLGVLPTYDTMLIEIDPTVCDHAAAARAVLDAVDEVRRTEASAGMSKGVRPGDAGRELTVPVVYGGEHGPDLTDVAAHLGVSEAEVVAIHSAHPLTVRCLAAAGSAMLDGPGFARPVPRLPEPRATVPTGAITVAGHQAVICPTDSPSGWRILGRSPLRFLDLTREPVTAYRPGDRIRFVPIPADQWDDWAGQRPSTAEGGQAP